MDIKIKGKIFRVYFKKRIIPTELVPIVSSFNNTKDINYINGSSLAGKVALVTGGYRGIGYAIAERLYREGASIIITGRDGNKLKEVGCNFDKDRFSFLEWDISNKDNAKEMLSKAINVFGKVDILVNNAGVNTDKEGKTPQFENMKSSDLHYINDINVIGTKSVCDAFVNTSPKGTCILNIISNTALRPATQSYFISKWAFYCYTKALVAQCKDKGIFINSICPGPIKTNMMWKQGNTIMRHSKNLRLGLPEEIGELSVMIAKSSFMGMNGRFFISDGGDLLV